MFWIKKWKSSFVMQLFQDRTVRLQSTYDFQHFPYQPKWCLQVPRNRWPKLDKNDNYHSRCSVQLSLFLIHCSLLSPLYFLCLYSAGIYLWVHRCSFVLLLTAWRLRVVLEFCTGKRIERFCFHCLLIAVTCDISDLRNQASLENALLAGWLRGNCLPHHPVCEEIESVRHNKMAVQLCRRFVCVFSFSSAKEGSQWRKLRPVSRKRAELLRSSNGWSRQEVELN